LSVSGPWEGKFYIGDRNSTGNKMPLTVEHSPFRSASEWLSGAVRNWITTTVDWDYRGEDEIAYALCALRDAGADAFRIFSASNPDAVKDLLLNANYLEASVHEPNPHWEFLYLGDAHGDVDLTQFLGYQMVVGRETKGQVIQSNSDAAANDSVPLSPDEDIVIAIAENERLDSASAGVEREIFTSHGIGIERLPAIHHDHDYQTVRAFIGGSLHLTHFNCHAIPDNPAEHQLGQLEVTENFAIPQSIIPSLPVVEESMVVLNCCYGHTLKHGYTETIATNFAMHSIAAVVASTERLVDEYANLWAKKFYKELLAGASVGPAILAARQRMINETANPACLVYGFFGRYSAKLVADLIPVAA
jgi:hypothetical protein